MEGSFWKRLFAFVSKNKMEFETVWNSNRICIQVSELFDNMIALGMQYTQEDVQEVTRLFPDGLMTSKKVMEQLNNYGAEYDVSSFYKSKTNQSITKPANKIYLQDRGSEANSNSSFSEKRRLSDYKKKKDKEEFQLQMKLIKYQNEDDFELVIKIAELNQIGIKLKNDTIFSLVKNQGSPVQIVQTNRKSGMVIPLNQKGFLRRFTQIKQELVNQSSVDKETQDSELKKNYIETVFLSQELQKQMDLLRRKGITSSTTK